MTEPHLPWLQGPAERPDPAVEGRSVSAHAAEAREDALWGHLYPKPHPEAR
jgi:hypothetical protein